MFDYRFKKLIKYFLIINIISILFITVAPIEAKQSNSIFISLIITIFISFFLFGCIVFYLCVGGHVKKSVVHENRSLPSIKQLVFNSKLCSFLSLSGFFLILYDRVFIRGINYSSGLRAARYQWLDSGSGSIFGVVGNLIIPFSYVGLFIILVHGNMLSHRIKFLVGISSLFGIVGHAMLNGGRSNVLIALFIFFAISIVKSKNNTKRGNSFVKVLIFSLIFSFILYMTSLSASMSNISYKELFLLGIDNLHGDVTNNYDKIEVFFGDVGYLLVYILSYLFHGSWTSESLYYIFQTESPGGSYLLFSFSLILTMLGILSEPIAAGYFSVHGAFVSLPGAFYYDTGLLGSMLLSLFLGMAVGSSVALVVHGVASPGVIAIYIYFTVIALMSPILPAYGLMYFNFVVYAFVMFACINRLFFGKSNHWL